MTFSNKGFREGVKAGIPIAVGVASYGFVFGILSRNAGLDLWEALCMSMFVFAGASQFVALDMWISPLPMAAIISTTFVVNLRHVLMGAVLADRFKNMTGPQKYGSLFFMVDENWAYAINEWKHGDQNATLLAGTGFSIFFSWAVSTLVGNVLGTRQIDPAKWGIDFCFTAIFIFIATGMWQGKKDLLPWIAAGVTAFLFSRYLPGKWYILAGGLAGSFTGMITDDT
ncbi:MAG: AzlC family ABC transporter permease [Desulfotignum sp.]|nr:AzlC family ABC transporter permease [Desulfotignum sp.]